jgi:Family of unknown function (DUF6055)
MMRKILFIIPILLLYSNIQAQQVSREYLDSLYYTILAMRGMLSEYEGQRVFVVDTTYNKCGFRIINEIKHILNYFTPKQQKVLLGILQRPSTDASFVTPNGFFRVHYYSSGSNAPSYNLTELAIALDSAYNFEINYLGYPPPPGDSVANVPDSVYGGDNRYDVYITNLGSEYGETDFENEVTPGSGRWRSFMEIDNDFAGFFTQGINAARVTVAHEFHHSIQAGNYIVRFVNNYISDSFFYEMTSTSMEHFVYKTIPDYLEYLPDYFNHPDRSFEKNNGYNIAIWNFYLQRTYGYDIIKRQWELLTQMRALRAINASLQEKNSSFGRDLNEFGIWTYYTGYRSIPGRYFDAASNYPLIRPDTINFSTSPKTVSIEANPVSNNIIKFIVQPVTPVDTLVALITNGNVEAGVDTQNVTDPFTYTLSTDSIPGSNRISENYFEKHTSSGTYNWYVSEILNNIVVRQDTNIFNPPASALGYVYPNPYYFTKNQYIYFPVNLPLSQKADLNIYSTSLDLIYSQRCEVKIGGAGSNVLIWKNIKDYKNRLASGVYLYIIKSGDQTFKGKFVVFQ